MKLSQHWLRGASLLILPVILFFLIRSIRIDQKRTLRHLNPVKSMVFVANGRQLATYDGNHRLWDLPSRNLVRTQGGYISGGTIADSFVQQGEMIAHFASEYEMELRDIQSGRLMRTVDWNNKINPRSEHISAGVLSPDGKTLATATSTVRSTLSGFTGNKLRLWDVATKKLRCVMAEPHVGFGSPIWSMTFSPDAKILAGANADGFISLWDTQQGKLRHKLSGQSGLITIVFSPDGMFLASGSSSNFFGQQRDGSIKLWDVHKGILLRTFVSAGTGIRALTFSPDSKKLASGTINGNGNVWDVTTGHSLQRLSSHKDAILSLAFTPDGKTLATGSEDKTVKLWTIN